MAKSSPAEQAAAMLAAVPEKTGKSLDAWMKWLTGEQLQKHGEIVKRLKSEHGVTHGYANLIAHQFLQSAQETSGEDDLVAAQYAGPKAALQPIYEALVKAIRSLGKDVEFAPKKAYVSVRRGKQFAIIQPSTKTRVDVGVQLKDHEPTDRLEASGGFNAMVSHRVRLESVAEVDAELKRWLKAAYQAAE